MQLTPEQEKAVLEMVATKILERLESRIDALADEVQCLTVNRVAGMLDVTPQQVYRILDEFTDFGPRDRRLTLAQVRKLVASRRVKARRR